MSEWNYFLAGILLMIGLDAGYLFYRLYQRVRKQSQRITDLEERMNYYNGAGKRGKPHMSWNVRYFTDDISTRIFELAHNNKVNSDLLETLFAEVEMMRKGLYNPDKPEREYAKKEDQL